MPAIEKNIKKMTLDEYELLSDDVRIEVFDGVVYDMSSPSRVHQALILELASVFNEYIKKNKGKCTVLPSPFDVVLSTNPLTVVQPDILIVCDESKLDDNRCNGAPDFVIEVVSPSNPSDDYVRKLYYYKNYGVREYWIVDPRRKMVTVNYFEGDILNVQYTFDATIKVNIYKDLYICIEEFMFKE